MGAMIAVIISVGLLFLVLLLAIEPPTSQQNANEVKRKIVQEKEHAMAEIDAATEDHKRQVFDLLAAANRQMVEEQAKKARRQAQEAVAQAAKEK